MPLKKLKRAAKKAVKVVTKPIAKALDKVPVLPKNKPASLLSFNLSESVPLKPIIEREELNKSNLFINKDIVVDSPPGRISALILSKSLELLTNKLSTERLVRAFL